MSEKAPRDRQERSRSDQPSGLYHRGGRTRVRATLPVDVMLARRIMVARAQRAAAARQHKKTTD